MSNTSRRSFVFAPRCKRNYNLFPDDRADALHPEYDGWFIQFGPTDNSVNISTISLKNGKVWPYVASLNHL